MRELQALNTVLEVWVTAAEAEQKHWLEREQRWVLKEEKLEQCIEQLTRELEAECTRPTRAKSKEMDTQTSDEKEDGSLEGKSGEHASSMTGSVPKPVAREDKVPKISSFSGAVVKDDNENYRRLAGPIRSYC